MNPEQGFALHPLAAEDLTGIWEYIAPDDPLAAVSARTLTPPSRGLARFSVRAARDLI
jgi:plasmid stabilization system protein ParE